jgi:hypothetical protein
VTARTVADARNALDNRVRQIRGPVPASFVDAEVNDLIDAVRRAAFADAASKLREDAKFGRDDHADPGEPLTGTEADAFERAALRIGAMP